MRPERWQAFRDSARGSPGAAPCVALITDSPWIPGYAGVTHLDYYLDQRIWFEANLRLLGEFPGVAFLPSWWVEYGMAIEPSAFGARLHFHKDRTPDMSPTLLRLDDVASMAPVDPWADGLMPLALRLYEMQLPRILEAGYTVPMVAARGPLCLASFLRGVTQLMVDIVEDPEGVHRLLDLTTDTVIAWLKAQAEVAGGCVESILVLDDIPGMLSRRAYLEFAHPYLKRVFGAFPAGWVKVYHNDANTRPFLSDLAGTGLNVLNWSHTIDVAEARAKAGASVCLMGNVAPLDLGVRGTPEEVGSAARRVLAQAGEGPLILSLGGGMSPGMPPENVRAMCLWG